MWFTFAFCVCFLLILFTSYQTIFIWQEKSRELNVAHFLGHNRDLFRTTDIFGHVRHLIFEAFMFFSNSEPDEVPDGKILRVNSLLIFVNYFVPRRSITEYLKFTIYGVIFRPENKNINIIEFNTSELSIFVFPAPIALYIHLGSYCSIYPPWLPLLYISTQAPIALYIHLRSHCSIYPPSFPLLYISTLAPIARYIHLGSHCSIYPPRLPLLYISTFVPIALYTHLRSHCSIYPPWFPLLYIPTLAPIALYIHPGSHCSIYPPSFPIALYTHLRSYCSIYPPWLPLLYISTFVPIALYIHLGSHCSIYPPWWI